jgi:hypothetical protein
MTLKPKELRDVEAESDPNKLSETTLRLIAIKPNERTKGQWNMLRGAISNKHILRETLQKLLEIEKRHMEHGSGAVERPDLCILLRVNLDPELKGLDRQDQI